MTRATILVRAGMYPGFTIDGLAINVVGEPGGAVIIQGTIVVDDLDAPDGIVLRGLQLDPPAGQLALDIRQQDHVQPVLVAKLGMADAGILADPDHGRTQCLELGHEFGELQALHGASRGVVLGIEIDHIFLA